MIFTSYNLERNKAQYNQVKARLIKSIYAGYHSIVWTYSSLTDEHVAFFSDQFIADLERLDGLTISAGCASLFSEFIFIEKTKFQAPELEEPTSIFPQEQTIHVQYAYRVPAYDRYKGASYVFYSSQSYKERDVSPKYYAILREAE